MRSPQSSLRLWMLFWCRGWRDSGRQGVVFGFFWGNRRLCSNFRGDNTPYPPWYSLFRATGEEGPPDSRTLDLGGTIRFLSCLWNCEPALHSQQGSWRLGPHVFCGLEDGFWPCFLGSPVGTVGVWGPLIVAVRTLYDKCLELGQHK